MFWTIKRMKTAAVHVLRSRRYKLHGPISLIRRSFLENQNMALAQIASANTEVAASCSDTNDCAGDHVDNAHDHDHEKD